MDDAMLDRVDVDLAPLDASRIARTHADAPPAPLDRDRLLALARDETARLARERDTYRGFTLRCPIR
jgi:hypothetical protein